MKKVLVGLTLLAMISMVLITGRKAHKDAEDLKVYLDRVSVEKGLLEDAIYNMQNHKPYEVTIEHNGKIITYKDDRKLHIGKYEFKY